MPVITTRSGLRSGRSASRGAADERGAQFERYDGMDQDERGITRGGGPFIAARFKDPAGNLLEVLQDR